MEEFSPSLERIKRDILRLSEFKSAGEIGHTRISFSREDRQAREHLARLMEEAHLSVRIDPAGNLIGRREGKKRRPVILAGSHLDTVRGGGEFDGVSGVIGALEAVRIYEETGVRNIHPIEVVDFLAEEPSPFVISCVGSRGISGRLSAEDLKLPDEAGRPLGEAILEMGGDPGNLAGARRSREDLLAYLELHIEQGPHLASRGIPIGVVTGIVGISRGKIEVIGRNDHAGTTPMEGRKDALAAGSEAVLAVEKACAALAGVVATVGRIALFPNAANVVPGRMVLEMEARSLGEEKIDHFASLLRRELDWIADRRGVQVNFTFGVSNHPVHFSPAMIGRIRSVCDRLGVACAEMPSGAGHDAQHVAEIAPAGMIFIPSREGRSHCPEEWTDFEQVRLGTRVLAHTIYEIDKEGNI